MCHRKNSFNGVMLEPGLTWTSRSDSARTSVKIQISHFFLYTTCPKTKLYLLFIETSRVALGKNFLCNRKLKQAFYFVLHTTCRKSWARVVWAAEFKRSAVEGSSRLRSCFASLATSILSIQVYTKSWIIFIISNLRSNSSIVYVQFNKTMFSGKVNEIY